MFGARRFLASLRILTWSVAGFIALGCGGGAKGPELGRVSGKVSLAGKPLPKANVQFVPEQGRPSSGITDESGEYELQDTDAERGAMVGKHAVRISTYQAADEDSGTPAVPESVPAIYNIKSELTAEVKSGSNEIDFDLQAGSPVIQPGTDLPGTRRRPGDCGGEDSAEGEFSEEFDSVE